MLFQFFEFQQVCVSEEIYEKCKNVVKFAVIDDCDLLVKMLFLFEVSVVPRHTVYFLNNKTSFQVRWYLFLILSSKIFGRTSTFNK